MSNRKCNAQLRHWYGPFYPPQVDELHRYYVEWVSALGALNTSNLVAVAGTFGAEFRHPGTERTEDQYTWARCLTFKILRGQLFAGLGVIMFPHCEDKRHKKDGTISDRCIALYSSTEAITEEELGDLAERYLRAFEKYRCTRAA